MSRALLVALVVMAVALAPRVARAQQAPPQQPPNPSALPLRQANYAWDPQGVLRASFSYKDVLQGDPALLKKLDSGLEMHIFLTAFLFEEGPNTEVTLAARECTVRYDLWDDGIYELTITEPGRPQFKQAVVGQAGVLRVCTEARDLAIISRNQLTAGHAYFLASVVDVNPASPQMIAALRSWIAQPMGTSGTPVFAGFVRFFATPVARADKTITFRTEDVVP
jgi:hypothetical protein